MEARRHRESERVRPINEGKDTTMKTIRRQNLIAATLIGALTQPVLAQVPASITTPNKVETRLGTLEFKDGMPSQATLEKVYDNLDFTHAFEAFVNTMQGVSIHALHKGFLSAGVKDNEVLIFSELMDAKSLYLTANADTVYAMGVVDLTKGPMVLETPPKFLGTIQDYWFGWVIDIGLPGPDRGEGGKYLICLRTTTVHCPRVGSLRPAPRPPAFCGSAARSWRTRAIRSLRPNRSGSSPRFTRTSPAASALPSPSSWRARPGSAESLRRRRPCSMRAAGR
jgi:hypothetical protein